MFGGAYLWREICVSESIGLALWLKGNLPFLLCFTLYLRAISKYKPPGRGLYLEGRFNGGLFALLVWLLTFGGAYFRNFTVFQRRKWRFSEWFRSFRIKRFPFFKQEPINVYGWKQFENATCGWVCFWKKRKDIRFQIKMNTCEPPLPQVIIDTNCSLRAKLCLRGGGKWLKSVRSAGSFSRPKQ